MEFKVDIKKKKKVQKLNMMNRKAPHITNVIAKILFFGGIVGALVYITVKVLIPSIEAGEIIEIHDFNIFSTIAIVASSWFWSFMAHVLCKKLASVGSTEKIDESIIIEDNTLRYVFRIAYQNGPYERYAIAINFNDINSAEYDNKLKELKFNGNLDYGYYENYIADDRPDIDKVYTFAISDYFEPSLRDTLESKYGVIIKNKLPKI